MQSVGYSGLQPAVASGLIAYVFENTIFVRDDNLQFVKRVEIADAITVLKWNNCNRLLFACQHEFGVIDIAGISSSRDVSRYSTRYEIHTILPFADDKIAVFYENSLQVCIYSLSTGQMILSVERPKFARIDDRRRDASFICRVATTDIQYTVSTAYAYIQGTLQLDSLDIKQALWSGSGVWLATSDNPILGQKIVFWCNNQKVYELCNEEIFVKEIMWITNRHNEEILLCASTDAKVVGISTLGFKPIFELRHTNRVDGNVSHLLQTDSGYVESSPPFFTTVENGNCSVVMKLGKCHLAVVFDTSPTCVWIWNLDLLGLEAVLEHLSAVREFVWNENQLLVVCQNSVFVWSSMRHTRVLKVDEMQEASLMQGKWATRNSILAWNSTTIMKCALDADINNLSLSLERFAV